MTRRDMAASGQRDASYVNEHCAYVELPKNDRRALRDVLNMAFPIGKSSHKLWGDFPDTTAFVRRMQDVIDGDSPEGIVGGAIVMSYPEDQYDYLAYIAILPEYRRERRLIRRSGQQHHGAEMLHYVYDVMRSRVSVSRMQRYLMIEPAGDTALKFYLSALPSNEYPLKYFEDDRIISVGYDDFAL